MIGFPQILTSSLDLDPCTYRWLVLRVLNLRQPRTYERNTDFGAAFAEAIFSARRAYYSDQVSQKDAEQISFDIVDTKFAPVFFEGQKARKAEGKQEEKIKTPDRLTNLLELYWEKFPLNKETLVPFALEDSFSAEQSLSIPMYVPSIGTLQVAIKPDLIALDKVGTVLLDEKTVSKSPSEEQNHVYLYMVREQFLLYAYGLRQLISSGGLNLPALHSFEVRRALLSREISSTKDQCTRVSWFLNPELEKAFFKSFLELMEDRGNRYLFWVEGIDDPESLLKNNVSSRAYNQCYAYGRACPLLEHCAAGRDLDSLGFKPSTVNSVTKEVTFD